MSTLRPKSNCVDIDCNFRVDLLNFDLNNSTLLKALYGVRSNEVNENKVTIQIKPTTIPPKPADNEQQVGKTNKTWDQSYKTFRRFILAPSLVK